MTKKREPFFDPNFAVHFEKSMNRSLCGSGWLQATSIMANVTCPQCLARMRYLAPICPRCHTPMVKAYIEHDDSSGWMCAFTCPCYRPDEEAFKAHGGDA